MVVGTPLSVLGAYSKVTPPLMQLHNRKCLALRLLLHHNLQSL